MIKHIFSLTLLLATSTLLADSYTDKYFRDAKNPRLNSQEQKGLKISQHYSSDSKMSVPPVPGDSGRVMFTFGTNPSVVCAVLQVCDIALQPGEQVNSINVGDSVRWQIEPSISGSGRQSRIHILIKPLDVGLNTTLFIATDRRSYHIRLKSHRTRYMAAVGFSYPEDAAAKWKQIQVNQARKTQAEILPTGENIQNLDFNYRISGDSPAWKPIRVYNDGTRTIIQMPEIMSKTEAPSLLVIRDGETTLVNYRLQNNRFIVDSLFDEAILITGVGRRQTKVVVKRSRS